MRLRKGKGRERPASASICREGFQGQQTARGSWSTTESLAHSVEHLFSQVIDASEAIRNPTAQGLGNQSI